jgi:electron transfer flavoprotein alpha subunit
MSVNALAYSEDRELLLQLLGKSREIAEKAGGEVCALLIGSGISGADELFRYGADKVYVVDDPKLEHFSLEPYRASVLEAVEKASPGFILLGATKCGKELAARVAAALDTGCMTECVSLEIDDEGRLRAERLTYGGSTISTQVSKKAPHVATVPARAFEKIEASSGSGEIVEPDVELPDARLEILERRDKRRGDLGLEEAPVIVAAGRGFKDQGDLKLLEELAGVLGAKMGCTRPIAADLGWMEEWIGISGRKVAPKLYVACGISGTIQHAAGIRDAQIIVSINNAETANIHEMSDFSLVGDIYTVLPALTKALKEKVG